MTDPVVHFPDTFGAAPGIPPTWRPVTPGSTLFIAWHRDLQLLARNRGDVAGTIRILSLAKLDGLAIAPRQMTIDPGLTVALRQLQSVVYTSRLNGVEVVHIETDDNDLEVSAFAQ